MPTPQAGATLGGDVGVLASDLTGTRTILRRSRFNQDTTFINDVPTEVRFSLDKQGILTFGNGNAGERP